MILTLASRYARRWKRPTKEVLNALTLDDLLHEYAFDELEPYPDEWAMHSVECAVTVNSHGPKRPIQADRFMPHAHRKTSTEEVFRRHKNLRAWMKLAGKTNKTSE